MIPHTGFSALTQIDISSHIIAGLLYVLAGLLLNAKNGKLRFYRPLQIACYATAITQLSITALKTGWLSNNIVTLIEMSHLGIWAVALWRLLENSTGQAIKTIFKTSIILVWLITSLLFLNKDQAWLPSLTASHTTLLIGPILLTLIILALIEQLFRNSTRPHRHNLKFLGIGLLVMMFTHLYSLAYQGIFQAIDITSNNSEGLIHSLIGLLFIFGSLRTQPEATIVVSRKIAFYGAALLSAGVFLLVISLAAYYVQLKEAEWSDALQIVLFIFSIIFLCLAATSRSIRSNIQVFVNKNFFRYKYDYRHVWLNLIKTLSNASYKEDFYLHSLKAAANVFASSGGALWLKNESGQLEIVSTWRITLPENTAVDSQSPFAQAFIDREWVYALGNSGTHLINPFSDHLPDWVSHIEDAWVITPLIIGDQLTGFFLLTQSANTNPLIWEDLDVLKTVGRQLASYIVRQKSAEQLAEAKQFDTYNRLTAFIMHDLKNLIAQQALVVENANKHKENPAFVEDAIHTIANSVDRMNHLLKRLQGGPQSSSQQRAISIHTVLLEAIRKSVDRQPIPTLRDKAEDVSITADYEQLIMILMHVIRNAQDATDNDGFIDVSVVAEQNSINIDIEDNGCGMDAEFLRHRLFKPFESTKSSMGMGIGAYQVREFIQNMGGKLRVSSEINVGTSVCITLPIHTSAISEALTRPIVEAKI
ncbi:MAG: PEP-CTERM system histidine kinase PrsK [Cellvibrionales bacterium]|nr:PEP-CTERM system histidine kinase PrsK [Cellvibrionales bacterium]